MFGQGVSPRLRAPRDGLEKIGLESHELLMHGSPRISTKQPSAGMLLITY
jgi:hypothetical protein